MKPIAFSSLVLLLALFSLDAQQKPKKGTATDTPEEQSIVVEVNRVGLLFTVVDKKGRSEERRVGKEC